MVRSAQKDQVAQQGQPPAGAWAAWAAWAAWWQALRATSPPMLWARMDSSVTGTGHEATRDVSRADSSAPLVEVCWPVL